MLEIIANAGIAEVILLFILVFIIPMTGYLVLRLRRYENEYGRLAAPSRKKKKKKEKPQPVAKAAPEKPSVPADVFPYGQKTFLTPPELALLQAIAEAVGAISRFSSRWRCGRWWKRQTPIPVFTTV